jgi:flagellar motor switch/type III secretory pathway protein FliN
MARYGQLSLSLEAELGRCTMPVRDILSLSPGSVLTLPQSLGSKIALFAGGAAFCSGDMIRTGGVVALRISSFENPQRAE